jgi:hypothetical protein
MLCCMCDAAQVGTLICDGKTDVGEDAYVNVGQDSGTLRVTIREAANHLGVTEAAIRKRIQRGSLSKELGSDGRVYVYLDLTQDRSHPESQIHRDPLVEELRDRLRFLEDQLQQANDRDRENRRIIAALTSRIPEIEAPRDERGSPETATEPPDRGEPRSSTPGPQEPAQRRSWWSRLFGEGG